jgi:hypothetical protein
LSYFKDGNEGDSYGSTSKNNTSLMGSKEIVSVYPRKHDLFNKAVNSPLNKSRTGTGSIPLINSFNINASLMKSGEKGTMSSAVSNATNGNGLASRIGTALNKVSSAKEISDQDDLTDLIALIDELN